MFAVALGGPLGLRVVRVMDRAGRLRWQLLQLASGVELEILVPDPLQQLHLLTLAGFFVVQLAQPVQQLSRIGSGLNHLLLQHTDFGAIIEFGVDVAFPQRRPELRWPHPGASLLQFLQGQPQCFPHAFQPTHPA